MNKLKIVYMGTPEFAVMALENLINKHEVVAVFTQPDKPKGRGHKLQMSPVKQLAAKHDIPVYQPIKLRNDEVAINALLDIKPDVIVVAAYGQILPKKILDIPRLGCVNIHASLLPKLRGAAPINWSIIRGDSKTGITTMLMNEGLDTGDMLLKEETVIEVSDTFETLHDKLMKIGSELILETLEKLHLGEISPQKQDDNTFTYAPMLTKELGHINWTDNCENIFNLIRGITPWPCAYTYYNDNVIKVWACEIKSSEKTDTPGKIVDVNKNGITVACGNGYIVLKEIQELGGKRMPIMVYLNGHSIETNSILS